MVQFFQVAATSSPQLRAVDHVAAGASHEERLERIGGSGDRHWGISTSKYSSSIFMKFYFVLRISFSEGVRL